MSEKSLAYRIGLYSTAFCAVLVFVGAVALTFAAQGSDAPAKHKPSRKTKLKDRGKPATRLKTTPRWKNRPSPQTPKAGKLVTKTALDKKLPIRSSTVKGPLEKKAPGAYDRPRPLGISSRISDRFRPTMPGLSPEEREKRRLERQARQADNLKKRIQSLKDRIEKIKADGSRSDQHIQRMEMSLKRMEDRLERINNELGSKGESPK